MRHMSGDAPTTTSRRASVPEEEQDELEQVHVIEGNAVFNEMIVWGHEIVPAADDPFVKGVEEWIAFAEGVSRRRRTPDLIMY